MSSLFFDTMNRLMPALRNRDLAAVEKSVIEQLRAIPLSPFHIAIDLGITNSPQEIAHHFDEFFAHEGKRLDVAAAYTEMNGFDINTDRWFCDLFAYTRNGGTDNFEWISGWQSERFPKYEINGLEDLQKVYASRAFSSGKYQDASYICSLLVVIKFQRFIELASREMKLLRFPLYVTAHDFEFIAVVGPNV